MPKAAHAVRLRHRDMAGLVVAMSLGPRLEVVKLVPGLAQSLKRTEVVAKRRPVRRRCVTVTALSLRMS